MLWNPKWEKPSIDGFKTWLAAQNPETEFDYHDSKTCAVGQYLASVGTSWAALVWEDNTMLQKLNYLAYETWLKTRSRKTTFGDMLCQINFT